MQIDYSKLINLIWDPFNTSHIPKILSLKSFGNLWGNSYILCLLLIITFCFTCGQAKTWKTIQKSQNIIAKIVLKMLFCILCLYVMSSKVAWGNLEATYCFPRQSWPKYMRQTLVLVWSSVLREKLNFNFWIVFCLYWQNFYFRGKTGL